MSDNNFAIMERKDEAQILSELQGVFLDKFVYSFKQGQNTVTGISWAGIKEIAYRIGEIDTNIEKYEETEDSYVFIVRATNKGVGSRLGVSNQAKMQNGKVDQFALQKALSKAQRNAIRGVIPEATIQQYLDTFMKSGNVDNSAPRYEAQPSVPVRPEGATVLQYLEDCGYKAEQFTVWEDEPMGIICIKPLAYMGTDKWRDEMRELGATYNKDNKVYVVNM